MKLEEIADIYIGATFRERVAISAKGTKVIQMKDLRENDCIDAKNAISIEGKNPDSLKDYQRLRVGDILFRSRGLTTTAKLLTKKIGLAIVSAPIFIIRTNSPLVRPDYLVWWINQPSSQAYFRSRSEGSLTKMVSKQTLANLQVELPSIEKQKRIAEFYELAMREQTLLNMIRIKRKHRAHAIMRQIATNSTNGRPFGY